MTTPAEPDAGDVEALIQHLTADPRFHGPHLVWDAPTVRVIVQTILASDWLDAVRRKAGADALIEAADEFAGITGDNVSAVQTWNAAADWLRDSAARIAGESSR